MRPLISNPVGVSTQPLPTAAPATGEYLETERILQLQAGSEEAFDWLVQQYGQMTYRLAFRLLHNPEDAADVVQDAFVKVFRTIGKFKGECALKTWIYRITLNTALNQNRWWKRHKKAECALERIDPETGSFFHEQPSGRPTPLDSLLTNEMQVIVHKALWKIDESHRTILIMREMEGLSYEEVADILHVSLGTVKSRLSRARHALRYQVEAALQPSEATIPVWSPAE